MSVASWRWARWPYCNKTASKLDSVQAHFLQILFPVFQSRGESADAFFTRKRLQAGRLASKSGRWSLHFASAVRAWATHLQNATFDTYWCSQINTYLDFVHMENLRMEHSRGSRRDRTNSRASHGHVFLRWHDGLEAAKGVASVKSGICSNKRFFGS